MTKFINTIYHQEDFNFFDVEIFNDKFIKDGFTFENILRQSYIFDGVVDINLIKGVLRNMYGNIDNFKFSEDVVQKYIGNNGPQQVFIIENDGKLLFNVYIIKIKDDDLHTLNSWMSSRTRQAV